MNDVFSEKNEKHEFVRILPVFRLRVVFASLCGPIDF